MDDNLRKQLEFETKSRSIGLAYLIWVFLGGFGGHRFYAGKPRTAIAQLILLFSVAGWLVLIPWLLVDLALIPGMINEKNMDLINQLNSEGPDRMSRPGRPALGEEPADRPIPQLDPKREAMLEELKKTGYKRDRRDNSHLYR